MGRVIETGNRVVGCKVRNRWDRMKCEYIERMSKIFETQNQFVIRFPEEAAEILNRYFERMEEGESVEMAEVSLEVDRERQKEVSKRIGLKVKVDKREYKATVMELPTICSTFKTIDHVNYFKSNDVCEMIVVHENEAECENIYKEQAEKIVDPTTNKILRYNCESGLTTPTKYIRQLNFKEKPLIHRQIVKQVDAEMEEIRNRNSQLKQCEKVQAKQKKLLNQQKS